MRDTARVKLGQEMFLPSGKFAARFQWELKMHKCIIGKIFNLDAVDDPRISLIVQKVLLQDFCPRKIRLRKYNQMLTKL
jgi:hypothetical protein